MPMPVEANVATLLLDDRLYKPDHRTRSVRGRVADSVANTNSLRPATNRSGVKGADCFRFGAAGVLSNVHDWQALAHRKRHRLLRHLQQFIEGPVFRKKTD